MRSGAVPRSSATSRASRSSRRPPSSSLPRRPSSTIASWRRNSAEVLADQQQLLQRAVVEIEAEPRQPPLAGLQQHPLARRRCSPAAPRARGSPTVAPAPRRGRRRRARNGRRGGVRTSAPTGSPARTIVTACSSPGPSGGGSPAIVAHARRRAAGDGEPSPRCAGRRPARSRRDDHTARRSAVPHRPRAPPARPPSPRRVERSAAAARAAPRAAARAARFPTPARARVSSPSSSARGPGTATTSTRSPAAKGAAITSSAATLPACERREGVLAGGGEGLLPGSRLEPALHGEDRRDGVEDGRRAPRFGLLFAHLADHRGRRDYPPRGPSVYRQRSRPTQTAPGRRAESGHRDTPSSSGSRRARSRSAIAW